MQGVATTPLECLGMSGYRYRLIFWMLRPPVLVVCVVLCTVAQSMLEERRSKQQQKTGPDGEQKLATADDDSHGGAFHLADAVAANSANRKPTLFEKVLPLVLTLLFVLYPMVTNNAFAGFPCYEFENGRGFLIADVSIVST